MEQRINSDLDILENSNVLNNVLKNEPEMSQQIQPSFEQNNHEYFEDMDEDDEDDEDDEEFEDAIDQIINQNLSDCLQQTGLSTNTGPSTLNSIIEQPEININTLHMTDSNLIQKLVEKQRKLDN